LHADLCQTETKNIFSARSYLDQFVLKTDHFVLTFNYIVFFCLIVTVFIRLFHSIVSVNDILLTQTITGPVSILLVSTQNL